MIEVGKKPKGLAGRKPTKRAWKGLTSNQSPQNPIRVARKYEEFLQAGDHSYADAAREFDVSRVTVCHYVALVRRLPADFVSWLESEEDAQTLGCFRECRLREVTRVEGETAQRQRLAELARELLSSAPDIDSGLAAVLNLTGNETLPWPGKELRSICLDR